MSRVNAIIAATCVASDMIMTPNIIIGVFMAPAMLTVETTMKKCS
jgi:hypothetical protein